MHELSQVFNFLVVLEFEVKSPGFQCQVLKGEQANALFPPLVNVWLGLVERAISGHGLVCWLSLQLWLADSL